MKMHQRKVRSLVETALAKRHGSNATFQKLRHASQALFRHFVCPQELSVRNSYNYDFLFNHSYTTGLSYGLQKFLGTSSRGAPFDVTSVVRCLKSFWKLLGMDFQKEEVEEYEETESHKELVKEVETEAVAVEEVEPKVVEEVEPEVVEEVEPEAMEKVVEQAVEQVEQEVEQYVDQEVVEEVEQYVDQEVAEEAEQSLKETKLLTELGYRRFKSIGQKLLVRKVLESKVSCLAVLPTGAGKSLCFQICATELVSGITLVIFPLKAVLLDALSKLKSNPLCGTLEDALPLQECKKRLIMLTAEQVRCKDFMANLQLFSQRIKRVIFDEAPVFLEQSFRQGLGSIPLLLRSRLNWSVPFYLLTGTLAPGMERGILDSFFCNGASLIRSPTARGEITHKIFQVPDYLENVGKFVDLTKGLTIVFVRSLKILQKLEEKMETLFPEKVVTYHGALNTVERKSRAQQWKNGMKPLMLATTAFAFGVDSKDCETVIHLDSPYDLSSYVQACGRTARRPGGRGKSIVLLEPGALRASNKQVRKFLSSGLCRTRALSESMDSIPWTLTCGSCDNCESRKHMEHQVSEEWREQNTIHHKGRQEESERVRASRKVSLVTKVSKFFERASHCLCCLAFSGKKTTHKLVQCPHWKFRCFRCGGKCKRRECKQKTTINKLCKSFGVCQTCTLPPGFLKLTFHKGEFSMGKSCPRKDKLFPIALLLWHLEKHAVEKHAKKKLSSFEEYMAWALDSSKFGVPNYLFLAYALVAVR